MNLSKVLKQKRDAEDRLRNNSPQIIFTENTAGEQSFNNTDSFLKAINIIQGENITLEVDGKNIIINSSGGGTLEQATETVLGGIKAKVKTTETSEVAIDTASGKLFVAASSSGSGVFDYGLVADVTNTTSDYGGLI